MRSWPPSRGRDACERLADNGQDGGLAALHLIASQTLATCPIQEWLFQAGRRDNVFLRNKIEPIDGCFALPSGPGLIIELDQDAIESTQEMTF